MERETNFLVRFFILLLIAFPLTLNAQEDKKPEKNQQQVPQTENQIPQTQTVNPSDQEIDNQINAALARLEKDPDEEMERKFEAIAETQSREIQNRLNLDDDAYDDIKEVINDYLKERWEARIELAQENDPGDYHKKAAKLAYLRVDLIDEIKDELNDEEVAAWDNQAVDFWLSLDRAFFDLKVQESNFAIERIDDQTDDQMN